MLVLNIVEIIWMLFWLYFHVDILAKKVLTISFTKLSFLEYLEWVVVLN